MTPAVVTIDVEPDNVWDDCHSRSFENLAGLRRFHGLCAKYGVRPTYLVTWSVAESPSACRIMEELLMTGECEIGAHSHVWEIPPLSDRDSCGASFGTAYPESVVSEKLEQLTETLRSRFGQIVSHRSGRWGFDRTQAKILRRLGYSVDTSVTPGVDWASVGGPDFTSAVANVYRIAENGISCPNSLLEVPCTIIPGLWLPFGLRKISPAARIRDRVGLGARWLRPHPELPAARLIDVCRWAVSRGQHLNLMTHSSELHAGTSPAWPTAESIAHHFGVLDAVFRWWIARSVRSLTLGECAIQVGPQ
jgi:hypothetical protein